MQNTDNNEPNVFELSVFENYFEYTPQSSQTNHTILLISITEGMVEMEQVETEFAQPFFILLNINEHRLSVKAEKIWVLQCQREYLQNMTLSLPLPYTQIQQTAVFNLTQEYLTDVQSTLNLLQSSQALDRHPTSDNLLIKFLLMSLFNQQAEVGLWLEKNTYAVRSIALAFEKLARNSTYDKVQVTDYAADLYVSYTKLKQICKSYFKKTPKQIIIEAKIDAIKRELLTTKKTIYQLSEVFQFEDATNFSKFFYKHAGILPLEFRNKQMWLNPMENDK